MRRQWTKEEKELMKIFETFIDEPTEAKEALKKAREIAFEIRRAEALGLPCKYDY